MMGWGIEGITRLLEVAPVPIHVQADEAPWVARIDRCRRRRAGHPRQRRRGRGGRRPDHAGPHAGPHPRQPVLPGRRPPGGGRHPVPRRVRAHRPARRRPRGNVRVADHPTGPGARRHRALPRPPLLARTVGHHGVHPRAQLRVPPPHARAVAGRCSGAESTGERPPGHRLDHRRGRRLPGRAAGRRGDPPRGPCRPVVLIGDETHPPYDRPPLSKQLLAGTWDVDRIHHHAPDKLDALGLEFRLGRRARVARHRGRHTSRLDDGRAAATTTASSSPPGPDPGALPGTEGMPAASTSCAPSTTAWRIRADLESAGPSARVVVIGAGFIGSEVAATCHGLGARVTVVEALPAPLARVLGDRRWARPVPRCTPTTASAVRTGVGVDRVTVRSPAGPGAAGGPPGRRVRPAGRRGGGRHRRGPRRRLAGRLGPDPRQRGGLRRDARSPPTTWWWPGTWPGGPIAGIGRDAPDRALDQRGRQGVRRGPQPAGRIGRRPALRPRSRTSGPTSTRPRSR